MSGYSSKPRVERDLTEHFATIAQDKIAPAERFLKVAEQSFERLAAMPGMGRAWESSLPELDCVRVYPMPSPYRSYLIFYRLLTDNTVEVLAVLHAARDIGAMIEDIL
jgi:plasmid stabilization system protein ParE